MLHIKQVFLLINNLFIPRDAYLVQREIALATESSQQNNIIDCHFLSISHAVNAVALSLLNLPLYLLRGIGNFLVHSVHLDFEQMQKDLKNDFLGACQSFLMTIMGIFYVFAGCFFPKQVFGFFTTAPQTPASQITSQQYLQERETLENARLQIQNLNARLMTTQNELDSSRGAIGRLEEINDGLAESVERLASERSAMQRVQMQQFLQMQNDDSDIEDELEHANAIIQAYPEYIRLTPEERARYEWLLFQLDSDLDRPDLRNSYRIIEHFPRQWLERLANGQGDADELSDGD